jgi:hypothetical protein
MHILELAPPSLRCAVILEREKKGLIMKTLCMAITATESGPEWVVKRLALASHVVGATDTCNHKQISSRGLLMRLRAHCQGMPPFGFIGGLTSILGKKGTVHR